jgi:hypothetical protein
MVSLLNEGGKHGGNIKKKEKIWLRMGNSY